MMETHPHKHTSDSSRCDGTYYMRIGKNGRATLPKQIRQLLDVDENMEVEVKVENGHVTLSGRLPTLEELAGSLPPLPEGVDVEEIVRQAKSEHYLKSHE